MWEPSGVSQVPVGRPFILVCHLLLSVGSEEPQHFSKNIQYVYKFSFLFLHCLPVIE